jgi:hypothetical protein
MRDLTFQRTTARYSPLNPWLAVVVALAGCDHEAETSQPIGLSVVALSGTSCGDPDAPTPGGNPFASGSSVKVAVRAFDEELQAIKTLVSRSARVSDGQALRIPRVPEGTGREVILFAETSAGQGWYGRDTNLTIVRNQDNNAGMVLTRLGGFSCAPTPAGIQSTVFPSATALGDGRVLVTGGFTEVAADGSKRLAGASNQAFIFDPRTGAVEVLTNMGANEGRAGHASVYLPSIDKVLIIGGMTELGIDEARPFPYVFDPARGRDDYVLFDVKTRTFQPGTDRMIAARGFPRLLALGDGTVLITGGGAWPFDVAGTAQIEVDIFDPEDNDRQGGLLDIPPMRSFFWRAGHSLTFLDFTAEGLTTALIWGGTTLDRSLGNPAEIFRQSGRQREGVNGTFSQVTLLSETGENPPFLYFHETTRLSGNRFLVTGGARHASGLIQAPEADEAWLLTYADIGGAPTISVRRVRGLGAGRVFHSALSHDLTRVSVLGGLSPLEAASNPVMTFDLATLTWKSEDAAAAQTTGRGAHAALLTPAGSNLLIGGEASLRTVFGAPRMALEVFTPATLPLP